jgi:hypothetical protein
MEGKIIPSIKGRFTGRDRRDVYTSRINLELEAGTTIGNLRDALGAQSIGTSGFPTVPIREDGTVYTNSYIANYPTPSSDAAPDPINDAELRRRAETIGKVIDT